MVSVKQLEQLVENLNYEATPPANRLSRMARIIERNLDELDASIDALDELATFNDYSETEGLLRRLAEYNA